MSLSVAFVLLTVGLSMVTFDIGPMHCGFSLLLVCMMTGTVFCNICPTSDELMDRLDRWVSPVNILFFVLSGAELDLNILSDPLVLLIGVVYIAFRSLGKISGAFVSGRATRCSHNIQKYLGITLLPQAGVALGMAAEAADLSDGHMVRNVVLFSVLVYELVGPTLTKLALTSAGEIIPGGPHQCPYGQQARVPGLPRLSLPMTNGTPNCFGVPFTVSFGRIICYNCLTVLTDPISLGREVCPMHEMLSFMVSVAAGVTSNLISKWLDRMLNKDCKH